MNFNWFDYKLKVDRYPLPSEIIESDYNYIINVSDEYIPSCLDAANKSNIKYFWFPINECTSDMGLNSIYAAMQILYEAELENNKVLLHCHVGANRSPMIADCYYFMRTGKHRPKKKISKKLKEDFNKMFGKPKDYISEIDNMNYLEMNCYTKHLPPLEKMEIFLNSMEDFFKKDISKRGGGIDTCKLIMNGKK